MSAPEPPVGFIGRTRNGTAAVRTSWGWEVAGDSRPSVSWEEVGERYGPLTPLYTPPAPTLVERMVEEYTVAVGHEENGMQAALAEVAAWLEEQPHPGVVTWDSADRNSYAVRYRDALLAALRAEAGQSDG